ncbi:hypothetical protein C8Q70DRAFT_555332 [Cubamyces menziesii]|nr:hypothetical protein C8Q70DRAFT_555332 [Cubamyces menziesii]
MSSSSQNHTGAPHTPYYTLTWNPLAFEPPPSLNSSSFILSRDSSFSSLSSTPGSPSPNPPTGGPAARPSSQAPLCSPASIEVTRKRNRTSLPQGTARDRELHALWQLSDAELAQKDDSLILETIEHRLRSTCYDHYLKTVERRMVAGSVVLCLKLECNANRCNTRRGKGPQPATNIPPYSEPRHRVLVALRCARRKRSFLSVEDPEYLDELKLVSQNALIKRPSQTTVRDDVERLYEGLAPYLAAYFQVCVRDDLVTDN